MTDTKGDFSTVPPIPPWPRFMVPMLDVLADGEARRNRDLIAETLDRAEVTELQREDLLPSGQSRAGNRAGWAMSFLVRAGAVTRPARAMYQITPQGRELLAQNPNGIAESTLKQLPAWSQYSPVPKLPTTPMPNLVDDDTQDPQEQIESGIAKFEADVASELIRRLRDQDPQFFEQAVVDLLIAMGYGGAEQRVRRLGRTGDGGVDGVIDQDALGLNRVYVQAKRYGAGNSVQRPDVQGFVGALAGQGATQGIFVTTSAFSSGARQYAESIQSRVVLIDGVRLAELMIQYRVGVQVQHTYAVVEVDEDYFE